MSEPAVDATAVEVTGTDLEPHQGTATLFRTDDPIEVVDQAARVAEKLKGVIKQRGMVQNIQGNEYVKVTGWQTLGSMLGLVPVVVWTREVPGGWEARVEARTLDGRIVGAAEAMCTKDENWWGQQPSNARRSMAQTRATSKALRGPLGFIVTLAGYEATPAEEMPMDDTGAPTKGSGFQGSKDEPPAAGTYTVTLIGSEVGKTRNAGIPHVRPRFRAFTADQEEWSTFWSLSGKAAEYTKKNLGKLGAISEGTLGQLRESITALHGGVFEVTVTRRGEYVNTDVVGLSQPPLGDVPNDIDAGFMAPEDVPDNEDIPF